MPSWRRTENPKLSKYFSGKELACLCGICSVQLIDAGFLAMLGQLRLEYGAPLYVRGRAFRCQRHQDNLRKQGYETAVGKSSHELGIAADVDPGADGHWATFEEACLKVFKQHSVGINRPKNGKLGFIHVDSRPGGPRRWTYK